MLGDKLVPQPCSTANGLAQPVKPPLEKRKMKARGKLSKRREFTHVKGNKAREGNHEAQGCATYLCLCTDEAPDAGYL